jgi:protein gp37
VADHTHIEWTDATWNPITGCSVVSAGCKHCYAMKLAGTRLQHHPSRAGLTIDTKAGPVWNGQVRFNDAWLHQPLQWKRPRRIFVCAHGDLFHEAVPFDWIDRVFAVMSLAPQHTFQVLTKRPERMLAYMTTDKVIGRAGFVEGRARQMANIPTHLTLATAWPFRNVWLGVSVEDQAAADERIPLLLQTPAAVRWVSAEPLLGPVDLTSVRWPDKGGHRVDALRAGYWNREGTLACGPSAELGAPRGGFTNHSDMQRIDWVVAGGESGTGARPMHPDWARSLRDQCAAAGVPFMFKQWGEWAPYNRGLDDPKHFVNPTAMDGPMQRFGKKLAGRLLDGVQHDGYPEVRHG